MKKTLYYLAFAALALGTFTGCEGAFGWVYDDPDKVVSVASDRFQVDASAWDKWYYIDLDAVCTSLEQDAGYDPSAAVVAMDVERTLTGEKQTLRGDHQQMGQYMYWFDVLGQGLKNRSFVWFAPTASQPAPEKWTLAIHRTNFRTNNGSVWDETTQTWREDEWSESEVWDDDSEMLNCYVPSQGIRINPVMARWLQMDIPPIPPVFTFSPQVLKLRDSDGRVFELEMLDYTSAKGRNCCYTFRFKRI